jgi:Bacterial SH3 domain
LRVDSEHSALLVSTPTLPTLPPLPIPTPYTLMNAALKSLQLVIGITIGLATLGGIVGGVGYYFFVTQMSTRPPKPVFAEERAGYKPPAVAKAKTTTTATPAPTKSPVVKDPNVIEKLPPEAYDAKVIWKDGLSLKKEPNSGAEKLGGVAFNAKVAIIKTSDDKQWVLIRSETDNLQGWVKAGNIDRAAAELNNTDREVKPAAPAPKPRAARVRRRRQVVDADADN